MDMWDEQYGDDEPEEDMEIEPEKGACLFCGKRTEEDQDFDTEYCAAKWSEEQGVPYFSRNEECEREY